MGIDPVAPNPENIHSFNRYAYANNNPYKFVDPDGRVPVDTVWDGANIVYDIGKIGVGYAFGNDKWVAEGGKDLLGDVGALFVPYMPAGASKLARMGADEITEAAPLVTKSVGRSGKQAKLRELANDDKLGSADRGWIKQEMNSIERGQRRNIRNPPGKDLAHERGREAAKGYGYEHSNLQDRDLHRLQHKYDNFGRKNNERLP